MYRLLVVFALLLAVLAVMAAFVSSDKITLDGQEFKEFVAVDKDKDEDNEGTKWAVLVAGSQSFWNYRHQSDVCHAYQILKKGGLKDENIIVFMYDDIAYNEDNPNPGVIINHPQGKDVYAGVPKDYVGDNVTAENFFAVLLGNKTALTGGSGKVVDSGPNDHIFIFYSDHGSAGSLVMPNEESIYADEFNAVLKKKYDSGSYKRMLIYIEACESGSIFEGLLSENMSIYATTAANVSESSYATYCPEEESVELEVCLGDLYSVSWMEDSDANDMQNETVKQQFRKVRTRTNSSHVMQYGDMHIRHNKLQLFLGSKSADGNAVLTDNKSSFYKTVNQRDADLIYFWNKLQRAPEGSANKLDAQKKLQAILAHRIHVDSSIALIGKLLFGSTNELDKLKNIRPAGQPLVDDWSCLKAMVRTYEAHCGRLSHYGLKYMRNLANICNAGVSLETMNKVSAQACPTRPSNY